MQLLLNADGVIIDIGETMTTSEPFIFVTKENRNYSYMQAGKIICEIEELPEGTKAQKHCYNTTTHEFTLNPAYVEYIAPINPVPQTEAPKTFIEKIKSFFGY